MSLPANLPVGPYLVVANDVGLAHHHGSKMVLARIVNELTARGCSVVTIPHGQPWRNHREVIDRASGVVVNGEGTLHHSAPAARDLVSLGPYCRERGIPAFLINSIWQDNSPQMASEVASFTARWVRESASQADLLTQGVESEVLPDLTLGWVVPTAESGGDSLRRGPVVITDSVVLADTLRLARYAAEHPGALFTTLTPRHTTPVNYTDAPFLRLPPRSVGGFGETAKTVLSEARSFAYRARGAALASLRRRRGVQREYSLTEFFDLLSSTPLLVTGRFHAVCLALLTGTPFLALTSNSHKTQAMLADCGLGHRVLSLGDLEDVLRDPPEWTARDEKARVTFVQQASIGQKKMWDQIARSTRTFSEKSPTR